MAILLHRSRPAFIGIRLLACRYIRLLAPPRRHLIFLQTHVLGYLRLLIWIESCLLVSMTILLFLGMTTLVPSVLMLPFLLDMNTVLPMLPMKIFLVMTTGRLSTKILSHQHQVFRCHQQYKNALTGPDTMHAMETDLHRVGVL